MIGLTFGSFNMQDPAGGVWVTKTDVYSSPENRIQAEPLAESDGALVVKQQFASKTFTVEGFLRSTTRAGLETLMDEFKTAMAQRNQAFDLDYAGGIRRYLANASNVVLADTGLTSAGFTIQFLSADGVGWSIDSENLVDSSAISTSTATFTGDLVGSYQVEPAIRIEFTSLTGGTAKTVQVTNGSTLRGIRITRTWASGDVLEVNSLKKTVFVNSQATDFLGQFPSWEAGTAVVNYLDDMTTRAAAINVSYTPRWL